ncbi:MAG: CehA/McbA family metallohydrolase [Rhodobacteraceae bacterium]|nr:CehA/McbA family metallohydrolase [Paracoccaceae bacterium]
MKNAMFTAPGSFWRGNLHTHSTRSDGALDPGEVCRRYKAEGYDFIALTDHFVGLFDYPITDTSPYRDDRFTTILGAEVHSGAMENGDLWHILAIGLPADFAPSNSPDFRPQADQETGPELAARARDAGAYVAIAHPEWSCLTENDARGLEAAHSVEVYNHSCAVETDRPRGFTTLDKLLNEGRRLTLCATDDAHFAGPDHFGGWVMVKSETNEPDALLAALKAGHHYASQGPKIHNVIWEDNHVIVESSAVVNVSVAGNTPGGSYVHGKSMTKTRVNIDRLENSPWMRVSVKDQAGNHAWLNPVWRD